MKILALEFSSWQRSAAVVETIGNRGVLVGNEIVETGDRSTRALGMLDAALREAKLEREQIECLAVGLGPGSYTGIRAAIAVAQGWQLARGVKLLGISSANCVAVQAQADRLNGRIAVVIDAQRNEFYLANYEIDPEGWRQVLALRLASPAEVQACQDSGEFLVGPEVTKWFARGRVLFPRAGALGQLAAIRREFVAGEKMEPIYLRQTTFVKAPPPRNLPA